MAAGPAGNFSFRNTDPSTTMFGSIPNTYGGNGDSSYANYLSSELGMSKGGLDNLLQQYADPNSPMFNNLLTLFHNGLMTWQGGLDATGGFDKQIGQPGNQLYNSLLNMINPAVQGSKNLIAGSAGDTSPASKVFDSQILAQMGPWLGQMAQWSEGVPVQSMQNYINTNNSIFGTLLGARLGGISSAFNNVVQNAGRLNQVVDVGRGVQAGLGPPSSFGGAPMGGFGQGGGVPDIPTDKPAAPTPGPNGVPAGSPSPGSSNIGPSGGISTGYGTGGYNAATNTGISGSFSGGGYGAGGANQGWSGSTW